MEQLEKILNVTNEELDGLNTSFIEPYQFYHETSYFHGKSGREHYRLLMYVGGLFKQENLFDIGTNRAMSAAALSAKMKNRIITYDIKKFLPVLPVLPYVVYNIGDCIKDDRLASSPFIFFDVDHNGKFEHIFYKHLKNIKYKGLVMCDDIHLNEPMKEWWENIEEDKYDITRKGHWSGTGLIHFK